MPLKPFEDESLRVWQRKLLNRLLSFQLFFLALAATFLAPSIQTMYGRVAFAVGPLLVAILAAALLPPRIPPAVKITVSISVLALGGFASLFFAGSNGVAASAIEAAAVLATLLVPPKGRNAIFVALSVAILAIVTSQAVGLFHFTQVNPKQPVVWAIAILLSLPGFAVVIIAQSAVVRRLREKSEALATTSATLLAEADEMRRAQARLRQANADLDKAVHERWRELEEVREEFRFFSEQSLTGLIQPLTIVEATCNQIRMDIRGRAGAEADSMVERLSARVRQMFEMIEGLRSLAGIGATELSRQEVDISEIACALAAELQESEPERHVAFSIEPGLVVSADLGLTKSALRNLLENAWKFTAETPHAHIEVTPIERDGSPGVRVSDNGLGFEPSQSARLFEPFHRSAKVQSMSGSGIGLSTVKRIAVRHGGSVEASVNHSGGATFDLSFGVPEGPFEPPAETIEEPVDEVIEMPSDQEWKQSSMQVLLVTQFIFVFLTLTIVTTTIARGRTDILLMWACLIFYPIAIWLPKSMMRARTICGVLPVLIIGIIAWGRTADFTAPMTISLDSICFALLFLGEWATATVGFVIVVAIYFGFKLATQTDQLPFLLPSDPVIYWMQRLPIAFGPTCILISTLIRALSRLENSSILNLALIERLQRDVSTRSEALAEAEQLHKHLDALVDARTDKLADATQALSTFTGTVAHDLRGPVRSLSAFATILLEDHSDELGDNGITSVKKFSTEIRGIGAYIERLISLARALQADAKLEGVDMSVVLRSAMSGTPLENTARLPETATVQASPNLARLAAQYLVREAALDEIFSMELSETAVLVKGCGASFLDAVESADSGKETLDAVAAWPSLAFVRICRRTGGRAAVELSPSGSRQLVFSFVS